ncbi:LLM class flavin-dependent oxidoreductase [Paractinoplanes brasiliensis]|uniref:Alkanesulfonate monooxygenase SsuD/methylene tetrahydromethanopterin reductase-like flavin-dependent oxidoreductase (Luciferase family) n=1 Tax=Paractinoplanes brasiliensis TaxID=52695 RepID=A0A4R6J8D3_9ACTN|nr:LLM class flavin-dependent oxidoreductase [Actinoplanes brasiliensis]TDO31417.1 alkanesulfonate monooxygenase SsuD/methylene tetrahydromethanopterin reductase-like flavin-dependent oxidoreductase (luciferase family) [Actinoplanes brasiliensis]GID30813.1 FMNH2-utilizing oxygenase [Actinoplanes brasiliensis]
MTNLHLAVALDGAGWAPDAWRAPNARPKELFTARYWLDLVAEAEAGKLDFVTIEDGLGVQSDDPSLVQGRLDAVLIASRVAPLTRHIGLVPTATVTHTEPFHISKAIATLDYVSRGRAGWRVQLSPRAEEAAHFGRREVSIDTPDAVQDLFDEAADYVEVVRRLWDSWEDDAEIRDAATGRFIDRDKLHYINFEGRFFTVKGPSITPRPPQGQPVVTALAHSEIPYRFAEKSADIVYVTPKDAADAHEIVSQVKVGHVFADLVVLLEQNPATHQSDAAAFTGTPAQLADLLLEWQDAGITGFRLRPGRLPDDLRAITRGLVPELRARGVFRTEYEPGTLRDRLGLPRPANRYAAAAEGARVA